MKKVIITAVIVLFALTALILGALYFVGDQVLDSAFDNMPAEQTEQNQQSSDNAAKNKIDDNSAESMTAPEALENKAESTAQDTIKDADKHAVNDTSNSDNTRDASKEPVKTASTQQSNNASKHEVDSAETKPIEKAPDKAQNENTQADAEDKDLAAKTHYTKDDIKNVEESVTAVDKIGIAAMLMKRLTAADINELKAMLPGGVSAAEKQRAKEIAYKRFNDDEIKVIIDIYMKYVYGE